MKKYGPLLVLLLALGLGTLSVFLANKWLSARASEAKTVVTETIPSVRIVIAARDLDAGSRLSKDNLALAEWPKASLPRGAFFDLSALEDRIAVNRLSAGIPVLDAELAAPGSGAGLVANIPPGMRAMTIKVDEVIGVGGFILPATFVDVIGVDIDRKDNPVAKTLLKRIKVLAIAQETFTEEGQAKVVRTVTVELTPEEAEKLALQTHKGAIHLVLRNPLEEEEVAAAPAPAPKRVVRHAPPKPAPVARVAAPLPYEVEVIRGSKTPQPVRFKNSDSDERL